MSVAVTRRSFVCLAAATGAVAAFGLTSCGKPEIYTAGTYEAAYEGREGLVPVKVEFSASEIVSVTVGENEETEGIGSVAIEKLPPAIIEAQSAEVDAVSGATETSTAILEGVADCIEQASI